MFLKNVLKMMIFKTFLYIFVEYVIRRGGAPPFQEIHRRMFYKEYIK